MNARSARSAIDSRRRRRAAERSRPSFLSARWAPSGSACCAREDFMRKKSSKKRLYAQYMCQYLHWKNQNQSVMSRLRRRHPRKPPERSRPYLDRIDQPGTKNPGASHCTSGAILCVRPDVTLVQFRGGCPAFSENMVHRTRTCSEHEPVRSLLRSLATQPRVARTFRSRPDWPVGLVLGTHSSLGGSTASRGSLLMAGPSRRSTGGAARKADWRPLPHRLHRAAGVAHARSTSNAATLRASLLNSTAMRWIGWPRSRYLSA